MKIAPNLILQIPKLNSWILSPSYQGNHNVGQYKSMQETLREFFQKEQPKIIDLDFLHENEIDHYTNIIFFPIYLEYNICDLVVQSKSLIVLRYMRRLCRKYVVKYINPKMKKGTYVLQLYNE